MARLFGSPTGEVVSFQETKAKQPLPVVVTVIEAGPLEQQVCLLVESLRRWGGRLAEAPVIAIKPRSGPRISSATLSVLERLNVEYRSIDRNDCFQWFAWLNKTAAVRHIAVSRPGAIVWFDADILVLNEPSELLLDPADPNAPQFAACASDKNIGTTRDDDEFAPYFRAACQTLGVDFASLPYILTEEERIPVRAYWNSGVYAFTGNSGLAELHHDFTLSLVAKGVGSHESKLYFSDQVSLGLAVHHLGLTRKNLPQNYNYAIQPRDVDVRLREANKNISILHYHGCLWPSSFDKLCRGLSFHRPDVAAWLRDRRPLLTSTMSGATRIHRKILQLYRRRQENIALRHCQFY
jgi:hypothetical protein